MNSDDGGAVDGKSFTYNPGESYQYDTSTCEAGLTGDAPESTGNAGATGVAERAVRDGNGNLSGLQPLQTLSC